MERKSFLVSGALILALAFGVFALATGTVAQEAAAPKEEKGAVAQKCLACHGPFDKIAQATADYVAPSGETVTPHQYIPHDEKKDIPECTECHKPHEIPLEDKSTVVIPDNLDYCYTSCHHSQNLQPCSTCH
jgi:hypothetical protein